MGDKDTGPTPRTPEETNEVVLSTVCIRAGGRFSMPCGEACACTSSSGAYQSGWCKPPTTLEGNPKERADATAERIHWAARSISAPEAGQRQPAVLPCVGVSTYRRNSTWTNMVPRSERGQLARMTKPTYSLRNLRMLLERNLTAKDVAEALVSFDIGSPADDVRMRLESQGFDVVGVRDGGLVCGFVQRDSLNGGMLRSYVQRFSEADLLPDSTPLSEILSRLSISPRIFVLSFDHVSAIITRGDVRKAPVRMWLFGLVSLLEMQLLRLIREWYPDGEWVRLISDDRLEKATAVMRARVLCNEETDLAECLELTDKAQIVWNTHDLQAGLGLSSHRAWKSQVESLRLLRDALAHARELRAGDWPALMQEVETLQDLLQRIEGMAGPAQ